MSQGSNINIMRELNILIEIETIKIITIIKSGYRVCFCCMMRNDKKVKIKKQKKAN